jgi:hypothetical protein
MLAMSHETTEGRAVIMGLVIAMPPGEYPGVFVFPSLNSGRARPDILHDQRPKKQRFSTLI